MQLVLLRKHEKERRMERDLFPNDQTESAVPMETPEVSSEVETTKEEWKLTEATMPEVLSSVRKELENNQKMVFDGKSE